MIPCSYCDSDGEIHTSGGVPSYTCSFCNGTGYKESFEERLKRSEEKFNKLKKKVN